MGESRSVNFGPPWPTVRVDSAARRQRPHVTQVTSAIPQLEIWGGRDAGVPDRAIPRLAGMGSAILGPVLMGCFVTA